jgi:tetratricopeptide (TPR) repeat protein
MDMQVGLNQHGTALLKFRVAKPKPLLALAALIAACALAPACGERADVYFEEARRHEFDYEFEKAAARYELVALGFKRSPLRGEAAQGLARCRAEIHFDRAEELIYAGATYTAIAEIAAGRRLDPSNPRALYLVGLAHRRIGPHELALDEFNRCVERYPESPYGYLGRAEYFRFETRRKEALADYIRAFRIAGRDARNRGAAFRGIRDMALKLGRPEGGLAFYKREARGLVSHDAFNYWVGYYYLRKKPVIYGHAEQYFNKVIEGRGRLSYKGKARAGRAECYLSYKDYEKAKADIDEAIAVDPQNDAYFKIAEKIYPQLSLPPPRKTQK